MTNTRTPQPKSSTKRQQRSFNTDQGDRAVNTRLFQRLKVTGLIAFASILIGCGLPSTGPNKPQIYSGTQASSGPDWVIPVNEIVNQKTALKPTSGFASHFKTLSKVGADMIRAGDTLGLTIWENVQDQLLGEMGPTTLQTVQVDGEGYIFVPYAGRIQAAGNTPESIRKIITDALKEQTPDPQVEVRRIAGDGATVSLLGAVSAQGIYPIERPTRTLSAMIAAAGGVTISPEIAQIKLIRGNRKGKIWLQDLYDKPGMDVALRAGDRILIEEDTRSFTALGATGTQARVKFEVQSLSAVEALAQLGGLRTDISDPTGVFILRSEREHIANNLLARSDLTGAQRIVYVLDLTQPNGIFIAREFMVRDQDTIYVTEAPFTQWSKTIAALTGSLAAINTVNATATGN